ncbi:MAG TPA: ectonucleotide pyrophosphatase/phosphodiesterase [Longimicrobiaceae bacterium]
MTRPASLLAALLLLLGGCAPAGTPATGAPALLTRGSGGVNRPEVRGRPHLVLVSFDGFRHDYLDRYPSPAFARVARGGVRAEGLVSVFPSKTFPNHYSVVTGAYAEQHGIVANSFWDPARGESYSLSNRRAVQDSSWYRAEPLWVTAEKAGMVASAFFWPGSEAAIGGVRPTFWKEYSDSMPITARVDTVLHWLRLPEERRPHVVTLYMSDVDNAGHAHGPDAPQTAAAVRTVDAALGRLLDGIQALPVRDRVYLVLVSDHGMATYTPQTAVALETLIDTVGVRMADGGPNANLHVSGGPERARVLRDSINRRLRNGRAYLRAELPERFHYRADPRAGDVVVVMDEHWQISRAARMPRSPGGTHGWDPELPSMHGIFLAMGPGIPAGTRVPAFRNVEIYPFMAEVLGLRPAAGIAGRPGWLRGVIGMRPAAAR